MEMRALAKIVLRSLSALLIAVATFAQQAGLYDYNHSVPFQYQEQEFEKDSQIEAAGAGFQSPKGGKVNMLVVRPRGRGPFAGIIYQHGGGQSMLTYLA